MFSTREPVLGRCELHAARVLASRRGALLFVLGHFTHMYTFFCDCLLSFPVVWCSSWNSRCTATDHGSALPPGAHPQCEHVIFSSSPFLLALSYFPSPCSCPFFPLRGLVAPFFLFLHGWWWYIRPSRPQSLHDSVGAWLRVPIAQPPAPRLQVTDTQTGQGPPLPSRNRFAAGGHPRALDSCAGYGQIPAAAPRGTAAASSSGSTSMLSVTGRTAHGGPPKGGIAAAGARAARARVRGGTSRPTRAHIPRSVPRLAAAAAVAAPVAVSPLVGSLSSADTPPF